MPSDRRMLDIGAAAVLGIGGVFGMAGTLVDDARIFLGAPIGPLSKPLPFFAYPFLVLTFVGWILATLKREPGGS